MNVNKIYFGDTLETLKQFDSSSVDMGITSPPYNKFGKKNKGWLVKDVQYNSYNDSMPENDYQELQIKVLNELYRIIKPGGSFFYNHKLRWDKGYMIHPMDWLRKTDWTIRQEIIWNRKIASNIRGYRFWQIEERIYWLYKPINNNLIGSEMKSKHSLLTSVWEISPEKKSNHPAPFPLQIPLRCIYSILDNETNKLIIDPYIGSGTTAIACKFLNHNYIGIDNSQEYIDMANERINNYEQEKEIYENEISKHFVKKTFAERKAKGLWNKKTEEKIVDK